LYEIHIHIHFSLIIYCPSSPLKKGRTNKSNLSFQWSNTTEKPYPCNPHKDGCSFSFHWILAIADDMFISP
jgi:Zn-finger protein